MYRFQFENMFYDYDALSHVFLKKEGLWRRLARIGCLLLVFCGVSLIPRPAESWGEFLNVLGFAAIMAIVAECIYPMSITRRSQKQDLQGVGEWTLVLDETGVQYHHGKGDGHNPWSAFVGGYYYEKGYFLFLDRTHVCFIPERALVEGDPATLRAFLEENLQKEIIDVR